ncbi:phosphoketolase family protein [Streptomyces vinaceus]|uniref:phosphoketolase family protein n=1 Tax=Streptomyces vinaceus TaxID=1960 RepID=UPI0037F87C8C
MTGHAADLLWRAQAYVAAAQIHLQDNVLLRRPLGPGDVKARPAGHWGTVPGTAWALAHVALLSGTGDAELVPLLGAGHAGVAQIAVGWLTGHLVAARPQFTRDEQGLVNLCRSFPEVAGLGSEVTPALPAGDFLGGRLGGCLPFAQGAALASSLGRVIVPLLGDGECETPTTAAAWLAAHALPGTPVLPIVHINGFRMGAPSLLADLTEQALTAYAAGLGWSARTVTVPDDGHEAFHAELAQGVADTLAGRRTVLFMRCVKGWSGPAAVNGQQVLGTARAHKTPLTRAASDSAQTYALEGWLSSYRPEELFTDGGHPGPGLAAALAATAWPRLTGPRRAPLPRATVQQQPVSFADAVATVVRAHARAGDFRVFSPDELASNRLSELAGQAWTTEVLAEEVLGEQLAGFNAAGGRGVLISYEAFAPLLATGIISLLKQQRMPGAAPRPSFNLLLTSYGWHNTYTHGDPSLTTTLLALEDPAIRVLTPADPARLMAVLEDAFTSTGQLNVIVAGKHPLPPVPTDTLRQELDRGIAVWPHLSDVQPPAVTVLVCGDLPAAVTAEALPRIRAELGVAVRVVSVLDLTVLGDPTVWPAGLRAAELDALLGEDAALLVVTLGHPAAIWSLLKARHARPVEVIGWREADGPRSQPDLAALAGMTAEGLLAAAGRLLKARTRCDTW